MKKRILFGLLILLFSTSTMAMDQDQLDNINYSFGHFLGETLKKAGLEYRIDQLLDGLFDATEDIGSKYSQEEMKINLAVKKTDNEDLLQRANYSHGFEVGKQIKAVEIEFLPEPFLFGATDVIDKKKQKLSKKEMTQLLAQVKKGKP